MIETKLILIEGPPGSGKSTTAQQLAGEISRAGRACRCFLEWSPDHPIAIGEDRHLGQVVATSISREAEVLRQWQAFVQAAQAEDRISVIESRFWQTGVMLMYAAGCSMEDVLANNRRLVETIQGLQPVLIYFAIDDSRALVARTVQLKDEEWQRTGSAISWAQHAFDAIETQKWFTARGLTGLAGMLAFLEEWSVVAEELYAAVPFPKITIRNPYLDWAAAMQQIRDFLELE